MSQTTRCPSCGTLFKVVADQLRISDGWVRCGQCQQVFDASSHLQDLPKAPLLPDLALDQLRAPPAPVSRTAPPARKWGERPLPAASAPAPEPVQAPGHWPQPPLPARSPEPSAPAPALQPLPQVEEPAPAVLQVPEPVVPAFLVAEPDAPLADGWSRTPPPQALEAAAGPAFAGAAEHSADIEWPPIELPQALAPVTALPEAPAPEAPVAALPLEATAVPAPAIAPDTEGGYELPAPVLDGDDGQDLTEVACAAESDAQAAHATPDSLEEPLQAASAAAVPLGSLEEEGAAAAGLRLVPKEDEALQPALQRRMPPAAPSPLPAGAVPAGEPADGAQAAQAEPDGAAAAEPSFLRAARRQAYWRRPWVRAGLWSVLLLLLAALALQVAVQERDFLAARHPPLRAGLQALCAPLGCQVAPYRDITAVEVESSSFQKLRGEEYRFSLVLKNRSGMTVAMPAVELTLTDAMDQPVLRRVLLPAQWAAPSELAARGEWAAARTVQLQSVPARIAGYRVVAFYP
ncbi:zinc-ribbon and DUF3426 domain-containing protein [Comamonas granuli]|uniref:zinc-ribbon and DUF3426 domain-containing protein n=1 Tax=Comamonas granuli TaxID=290309 RepID=UPI0005AAC2C6|nr:zinc-ribbon and DUF3426 domain-containing protein [Comamonas granuli]